MRPLETRPETICAIDEALAWHDGDARAAIATLIADCAYLRWQLDLATLAMGAGFTRGWHPSAERPDGV
ncbi:dehydrogenase [Shinella sp. AETb1-6]|uniref:dehydrogenase n=1 Tax=Shinella sp. AETb1-6 TaxID=2692210 RepID=UPI001369515F|nr:dehydrogenase [Shinella sp. AETb1-6]MXN51939.1 dehydrogenase [Shinella sp. AETb1-6]